MKPSKKTKTPAIIAPEDYAAEQTQIREEAWHTREQKVWNAAPLKPWTRERDALFVRLIEHDESGYSLDSIPAMLTRLRESKSPLPLDQLVEPMLYIEQAALVLYLASHEPEQWDHLRGRRAAFLRASNAWAETSISLGEEWPAIHRAVELRTAHRQLVAIRRPSAGSSAEDLGN